MAGMVDKRGFTDPRLQAMYANYVTDEGNQYGARYNPDARQASVERMSKEGNIFGVDVAPNYYGVRGEYKFANGGDVKHYKKGDYVLSSDYDPEAYGTSYREGLAGLESKYPVYSATDPYGNVRKKAMREYQSSVKTPYDDAIRYYEEQGLGYKGKLGAVPGTTPVRKLEAARDEWIASQGTMPAAPAAKPSNEPDVRLTGNQQPPVVNPYAVDTSIPKPFSVEEAMKRQQEAMQMAGVDPDFYKKQAAELLEQREALKGERSDAANLALLKAGLATMGGTSPFALVNLGKGAEAGVEQYTQDTRNIRTENRLLKQADLKLKEAQNAQQRGDAQGALKAIQEREKIISDLQERRMATAATLEAAKISAGARTGMGQLPALYRELNKAQQAGNQTLADQIQSRIDDIEAGVTGGGGAIPAGVTVKKNK
jgi:hypothetical protein